MANKLAGQRAKFSRARAILYTTGEEAHRQRAIELMAEVLAEAPANGFSEEMVTQGEDVPEDARQLAMRITPDPSRPEQDEQFVEALQDSVDTGDVREAGDGAQFVYAYGYRCAPDRLKIGSCAGEVEARIAAQIGTSTPDKPVLLLKIRTDDCRALERVLHGIFRLKNRKVIGAGAEWFVASRDEVIAVYERAMGSEPDGSAGAASGGHGHTGF